MKNKTQPYLAGRFFDSISSGLFMMALPWVMLSEPNMGTFVALVSLSCTAISFLATPFFSTLIDRHSRKVLLVLNQWIQSGMALVVFIAYWLGFESHWLLAFAQLVYWVSSNFAWTTNNAFTQENYQHHEYAKISGQQEIVMQSTTLGAGALGIVLLEMWGYERVCFVCGQRLCVSSDVLYSDALYPTIKGIKIRCFHRATQREQANIPSRAPILWLYSALLPLLSCIDVFEQTGADLVF